jgi:hypothetical protein
MRIAIAKSKGDLFFKGLPIKPVNILGQEFYDLIRVKDDCGNVSYKKVKEIDKPVILKSI